MKRDLEAVFGPPAAPGDGAAIVVEHDPSLADEEAYLIRVTANAVTVRGGGALGMVYGLYRVSHDMLGVDPMAFWKDLPPERRDRIDVPEGETASEPATFRYRGWFVNDEDLLTGWWPAQGPRDIDYPFYATVVNADLIDKVCESALRCGMNLIIPASFLDVMNEPEADLLRTCVRRGLYVSQHHVEPLGVSHFGFENYWRKRGEAATFSFKQDPDRIRQTWRDYAQRWAELAGDRVIWQLGLRGRGDRPVWRHDPSITAEQAGDFISQAMGEQYRIACEVDARDRPPATTTLWMEGTQLMADGKLRFPEGLTLVFADHIMTQTMGRDFHDAPRDPRHTYGVYWHPAVWPGPHLAQGADPAKVQHVFHEIATAGDTHYAIINVTNIREHVLGVEAASRAMHEGYAFDSEAFLDAWAPPGTADAYRRFIAAWPRLDRWHIIQDGDLFTGVIRRLLAGIVQGANQQVPDEALHPWPGGSWAKRLPEIFPPCIASLDALVAEVAVDAATERWRPFVQCNLLWQARFLRDLYELALVMLAAARDTRRLADAVALCDRMLADRAVCEQGRWRHWYRGEDKIGLADFRRKARGLYRALHEDAD